MGARAEAMSAKHVVDVGAVVAQVNGASAVDGRRVIVAADEENLSASLADSKVGAEIYEIILDGSQACLQFVSKLVVAAP